MWIKTQEVKKFGIYCMFAGILGKDCFILKDSPKTNTEATDPEQV